LPPSNRPISSSETCKNEREACACTYLYFCVSSTSLLTHRLAGVREGIITITQRTRAHRQARDDDGSLWRPRVRAHAVLLCWRRRRRRRLSRTVHSASVRRSLLSVVVLSVPDIAHPFEFRCPFSLSNAVGRVKPTRTIDRHPSLSLVFPDRLSPLLLSSHRVTGCDEPSIAYLRDFSSGLPSTSSIFSLLKMSTTPKSLPEESLGGKYIPVIYLSICLR